MNIRFRSTYDNRCKTCLMPDYAVVLNDDGCNYCCPKEIRKEASVGKDLIPNDNEGVTLEEVKRIAASSTGKYDCLVGLSGGRDSTFLLYYAKKVLGLNPLAANFRTRFQTDEAKHNIEDATSRLEIDLFTSSIDDLFFQKLVNGFFVKYGDFCSPCHKGHHYTLAKCAKEHGIKAIIRGISSKIDMNRMNPDHFDHFCRSEKEFNDKIDGIRSAFKITDEELINHHDMLHLESFKDKSVRTIDLPDFLDWDYECVQEVLDSEFDWIHPKNQFFHCDCRMNPTLCYLEFCKDGYSEKQIIISNHLASHDITLQKGYDFIISEEVPNPPYNIDEALRLIDVDRTTFDRIAGTFWKRKRFSGPRAVE
jgi:PP-loop superfamily ATP-utilizing enzyme